MAQKGVAISEREVLADIISTLSIYVNEYEKINPNTMYAWMVEALDKAERLYDQVKRGVHRNPPLVIFGNPPREGREFGTDVLAVLYRHKKDGEFYCHGFGNADIELEGTPFEGVTIHRLKERTGVKLIAMKDGTVVLSKPGTDLWEDIKP